jgi:hypothetical protein
MSVPNTRSLPEAHAMETRRAFVLWLSADSGSLEGRLEEVDTGRELRFQSSEQLIAFLEECLRENR